MHPLHKKAIKDLKDNLDVKYSKEWVLSKCVFMLVGRFSHTLNGIQNSWVCAHYWDGEDLDIETMLKSNICDELIDRRFRLKRIERKLATL